MQKKVARLPAFRKEQIPSMPSRLGLVKDYLTGQTAYLPEKPDGNAEWRTESPSTTWRIATRLIRPKTWNELNLGFRHLRRHTPLQMRFPVRTPAPLAPEHAIRVFLVDAQRPVPGQHPAANPERTSIADFLGHGYATLARNLSVSNTSHSGSGKPRYAARHRGSRSRHTTPQCRLARGSVNR
jgi:hypothetical protein